MTMKTHKLHDFFACMIFNCFIVLNTCFVWGQTVTESYNISFDRNDIFIQQEDSFQLLSLKTGYFSYLEDESKPMLPFVNKFILIPQNATLESVSCIVNSTDHYGYVKLPSNPLPVLINSIDSISSIEAKYDDSKTYPNSTIDNYFQHVVDGYKMVGIRLCPFVYNSPTDELRFITNIDVSVQYEVSDTIEPYIYGRILKETVKNMAINGDTLETLYPEISTFSSGSTVDYLIITADSLKNAYKELAEWKLYKGLTTRIISVEYIDSVYSGRSKQEKIKNCLNEYFDRYGLKYVLLGGDNDIIPTQYAYASCYMSGGYNETWIPTDAYYSCLYGGDFYWDSNNNGIIGELNDDVSYNTSIIVSRLPLNHNYNISQYTSKLKNYEQGNYSSYIYDRNFFVGSVLTEGNIYNGLIDSHYWGDSIYNSCIKPYSNSEYLYFYDSGTNVFEDSIFFNIDNLKTFLKLGGNISHVDCHGTEGGWFMSNMYFNSSQVASLGNATLPFIFTTACRTNNFTNSFPCLGESFFLNQTRTIGYLGSTVDGISYGRKYIKGPSIAYNEGVIEEIYKNNNTNFGNALAATKAKITNEGLDGNSEALRWLSLSLNTLGDPECSIFKGNPSKFKDIICYRTAGMYYFDTNVSNSACSIIRVNTNSKALINKKYGQLFSIALTSDIYQYSFTKQGYEPYITGNDNLPPLFIQDETFENDFTVTAKHATIGCEVTDRFSTGNVCIPDGINVSLNVDKGVLITNGFTCEKGGTLEITVY